MIRNALNTHLTKGLRRALRVARYEWRLQKLHRAAVRKAKRFSAQRGLLLNLGSGENRKPGWLNIDRIEGADLQLDLRERFPFAAHSVRRIYSEHFFEHLAFPRETSHFLSECRRVLEPGGELHLGVPDTEWPILSYPDSESEYFRLARERLHPRWCNTRMHNLNFHFRQGDEHKYAYDEETLVQVLRKAGFAEIRRREFDPSLDSSSRRLGTLYVRAKNPV